MRVLYVINPSKDEQESSFFESFLTLEPDISTLKWEKIEKPDFILHGGSKNIGVEVTSLANPHKSKIRKSQLKVFDLAKEKAIIENLPILEVQAKFRSDSSTIDVDEAVNELVNIVKTKLPTIDDSKTFTFYNLPLIYFETIFLHLGTLHGQKWLENHRWHHLIMNWITIDPIVQIQQRINEKNKKVKEYLKKCDECWLLIGVDEWKAAEAVFLTEQCRQNYFHCSFSRLYFLRNIERKLYRLNIKEEI